mmetsp:Transcript_140705/g.449807  ORF Transcript_140705/g.449807 Transcript_140705/m.449807 type:complete len:293 (+) Transcript_140705:313-1191(+)
MRAPSDTLPAGRQSRLCRVRRVAGNDREQIVKAVRALVACEVLERGCRHGPAILLVEFVAELQEKVDELKLGRASTPQEWRKLEVDRTHGSRREELAAAPKDIRLETLNVDLCQPNLRVGWPDDVVEAPHVDGAHLFEHAHAELADGRADDRVTGVAGLGENGQVHGLISEANWVHLNFARVARVGQKCACEVEEVRFGGLECYHSVGVRKHCHVHGADPDVRSNVEKNVFFRAPRPHDRGIPNPRQVATVHPISVLLYPLADQVGVRPYAQSYRLRVRSRSVVALVGPVSS